MEGGTVVERRKENFIGGFDGREKERIRGEAKTKG